MRHKLSLFDYFHIVAFIMFVTFTTIFISLIAYTANSRFERDSQKLKNEYLATQKQMVQNEVEKFVDYIEIKKLQAHKQTQDIVKLKVNEAHKLVNDLYEKYKNTQTNAQMQEMIIETLRALRYEGDKGYFFIIRTDGVEMLFTDKPQLEGKNMLPLKNSEGRYIVRGMINVINSSTEGFYEYAWSKPNETREDFKKITFLKLFEPYGWIIGTGLYLDDTEAKVKEEIINNENRLNFDKTNNNFIFIGDWNGLSLTHPSKNKNMYHIVDENGKFIVQELIETARNGGGFVEYIMPPFKGVRNLTKLSYVKDISKWQWYVGAGVYLADINDDIAKLEKENRLEFQKTVLYIALLVLFFSLLLGVFYFYLSRKIKKDFKIFTEFFDSLASKDEMIDLKNIKFKEFDELAIHANRMLQAKLTINKNLAQYKKIVSSSDDLLSLIDKNYVYLAISEGYLKFFNKTKDEILGHSMVELFGERYFVENLQKTSDRALGGESFENEFWVKSADGMRYLHAKYFPYMNEGEDKIEAYSVSARDVTEKKTNEDKLIASEKELEFLAHNDGLTGLPNKILLNDRIAHAIQNSTRRNTMLAICFIDLDNFKKINDSFGHSYGDNILQQVATRIQAILRVSDTLSRIGGDEFILLIEGIKSKIEIDAIVTKLQTVFEESFVYRNQKFFLSASMGISVYPDHGLDSETLIKNADTAMYKAKDAGKNTYAFYTLDMTIASYERIGMENALREAVKEKQFIVYYQPQIDLQTGKVIGAEALVRWNHPSEGILAPGRFIGFAEETRLIIEIGSFVLRQASLDLMGLKKEGLGDFKVSVNVSGIQIEYSDFLVTLKDIIEETKIHPSALEMEVTESFIMNDPERWIALLQSMRLLGVSIAIDDFGTGHSSLSYLRKLPIDKLKVDMSFIKDIPHQEDACSIVNSIIDLAHNMKMSTLAEGIETQEQASYLAANQCVQGQGYLYAKPMNLRDFREWLKQRI